MNDISSKNVKSFKPKKKLIKREGYDLNSPVEDLSDLLKRMNVPEYKMSAEELKRAEQSRINGILNS